MTNWIGVAAVTRTLVGLLLAWGDDEFNDLKVTAVTPDQARKNISSNQLNVFLYQVAPNVSLAGNMDMPGQVGGTSEVLPLALDLSYLVTSYGTEERETDAEQALARAMLFLHDHPVLDREEIRQYSIDSNLADQIERVRITLQPLTIDEMSKLWTMFQAPYRRSAAYQVSVILVESVRPTIAALPVLRLGADDRGVQIGADLVVPVPTVTSASPPSPRTSALVGDTVRVGGHHLAGDVVEVVFRHPRMTSAKVLLPDSGGSASELSVSLDPQLPDWVAGISTLAVEVTSNGPPVKTVSSNEVALAIAPQVSSALVSESEVMGVDVKTLDVTCDPPVVAGQRVSALLGDQEAAAQVPTVGSTVHFDVTHVAPGPYLLRLRVDGVDSHIVDFTTVPPSFSGPMVTVP